MVIPQQTIAESDELLARAEVAALLRVAPSTVTRWADAGKFTCVRTLGGHRRYLKREITAIMHQVHGKAEALDRAGKEASMQEIQVEIPKLYGDHHTLAVQQTLAQLPGVEQLRVSPAMHRLRVGFDPERIGADAIIKRLARAGYPVRNGQEDPADHRKDPAWARLNLRMTQSYRRNV